MYLNQQAEAEAFLRDRLANGVSTLVALREARETGGYSGIDIKRAAESVLEIGSREAARLYVKATFKDDF